MYCLKCGKELDDNAKFCSQCGTLIEEESFSAPPKKIKEKKKTVPKRTVGIGASAVFFISFIIIVFFVKKIPENHAKKFQEYISNQEYEKAWTCLDFADEDTDCFRDDYNKTLHDDFPEFASKYLQDAEYFFDKKNKILSIETQGMKYQLPCQKIDNEWYLMADDFLFTYKVRYLSLAQANGEKKLLGKFIDSNYLGDGIQEYTLLNYRVPVITLGYDVIIGDEEKMIYISISVDADGNLQKIEGISSHSTGNLVGNYGQLEKNILTINRYEISESYAKTIAKKGEKFYTDVARSCLSDRSYEEFCSNYATDYIDTPTLRHSYNLISQLSDEDLELLERGSSISDVTKYRYETEYYIGNVYTLTVQEISNGELVEEMGMKMELIPGEDHFILKAFPEDIREVTDEEFSYYVGTEYEKIQEDTTSEEKPDEKKVDDEEINEEKSNTYIIPGSDSRYLTDEDVAGLNANQLRLARNEIFARHGRKFKDATIQQYFEKQSWYQGTIEPEDFQMDKMLNKIEKSNIKLIEKYEDKLKGVVTRTVPLYAGVFQDLDLYSGEPDLVEYPYGITVLSYTDTSFDFQIWEDPLNGKEYIVLFAGTATFTGDGSIAVYKDDNYTLTFSFPLPYQIDVTGYKPMEGGTYLCSTVPGYEAS